MRRHRLAIAAVCALLLAPYAAAAQTPLAHLLVRLYQADIVLAPPAPGFPSHEAHFEPGDSQELPPWIFNQNIVSQLSTFPLGSSSGGFSYTFDPETGTPRRATDSFGPAFAERALTIGRRQWNIGMYYQHASYDSFEGQNLQTGGIKFYLQHKDAGEIGTVPPPKEWYAGDLIQGSLSLKLKTDTTVFYANYGATSRMDVGIVVPVVHVSMQASVNAQILHLATADIPQIHQFPGGSSSQAFNQQGSATGIGDVLLRAKYRFWDTPQGGLAAGLDVRLPTGNDENLLGTGATQAKVSLIASTTVSRFAPHVNVGYTFSRQSSNALFNISDEIGYSAGLDWALSPRLTVAGDFVGRTLRNFGRMQLMDNTYVYQVGSPGPTPSTIVLGPTQTFTATQFMPVQGNLNIGMAGFGAKFNAWENLLVSAHVLMPMTSAGLRANAIPVIGVDWVF